MDENLMLNLVKIKLPVFFTKIEEDLFTDYLKNIKVITKIEYNDNDLFLYFDSFYLNYDNFIKIKTLILRYKIDKKYFDKFYDVNTNKLFNIDLSNEIEHYESKKIGITIKPLQFYSHIDKELFYRWLGKIASVENCIGIFTHLNVLFRSNEISATDFKNLDGLFKRYNLQNIDQLKSFLNKKTKEYFL